MKSYTTNFYLQSAKSTIGSVTVPVRDLQMIFREGRHHSYRIYRPVNLYFCMARANARKMVPSIKQNTNYYRLSDKETI